jgi:hypothetical protein
MTLEVIYYIDFLNSPIYQYATKEISPCWLKFKIPGTENLDKLFPTLNGIVQLEKLRTISLNQRKSSFLVGLMNLPKCPENFF